MAFDRRSLLGAVAAAGMVAVAAVVMVPLRSHLGPASALLVLVVPVVVGVTVGGAVGGATAVVAGFVAGDLLFVPPYGSLAMERPDGWVALGVYSVVFAVATRVVADQRRARAEASRRQQETRRLFELSESLLSDAPDLHERVVDTVQRAFQPQWTALFVPGADGLEVAATSGAFPTGVDLDIAMGRGGTPVRLLEDPVDGTGDPAAPVTAALVADGLPVGLLAVAPAPSDPYDRRLLATFANQAALAIARARLREQAVRSELLEAAEEARRILLRTVSHDLRTPLSTIKASLSGLRHPAPGLGPDERAELLALAEEQADRLDRLVANLLDMTRIEAGALVLRRRAVAVADLVEEALAAGGPPAGAVSVDLPDDLPPVDVDHTLVSHALVNLVENALRYSPEDVRITAGRRGPDTVEIAVTDRGPGVPAARRAAILPSPAPARPDAGGPSLTPAAASGAPGHGAGTRTGLGLAIAGSFVAAHGGTIRVDDNPGGGARFSFTLPVATARVPAEPAAVPAAPAPAGPAAAPADRPVAAAVPAPPVARGVAAAAG